MPAPITTKEMTLLTSNIKTVTDAVTGLKSPQTVGGYTYQSKISIGVTQSDAILIPQGKIRSILYSTVGGSVTVYSTISSVSDIVANTAQWVALSSGAPVDPGVTALYFNNASSTSAITVKVLADD